MRMLRLALVGGVCAGMLMRPAIGSAAGEAGKSQGPGRVAGRGPGKPRAVRPGLRAPSRSRPLPKRAAAAWDQSEEETIVGVVSQPPAKGKPGAFCSMVVSRKRFKDVTALLAPWWYVDSLGLRPNQGDEVQVVGVLRKDRGDRRLFVREVTWGGRVYRFRTAEGQPLWAGADTGSWLGYTETWNSEKIDTISGRVLNVSQSLPDGNLVGMGPGVEIRVETAPHAFRFVQLGPKWYVDQVLPGLKAGDQVTVTGSVALWRDKRSLFASEVERVGKKVRLRGLDGKPDWPGGWQNWSGWGPGSPYHKLFDAKKVQTISGSVVDAKRNAPQPGLGQGTVITVLVPDGRRILVHLAPTWFMQQTQLRVSRKDQVTVSGVVLPGEGRPVMMAGSIAVGGRQVQFRDAQGVPVWLAAPQPAQRLEPAG